MSLPITIELRIKPDRDSHVTHSVIQFDQYNQNNTLVNIFSAFRDDHYTSSILQLPCVVTTLKPCKLILKPLQGNV